MRRSISLCVLVAGLTLAALALDRAAEHFMAMAVLPPSAAGSSTVPLNIDIQAYTSDSTLNSLGDILSDGNNQTALLQKFESMPGIGDVSREGRVGVEVKVIRVQQTAQGLREITMLTDRPIHFWELTNASPTADYPYGMIQFTVDHNGNGTGKAYPVAKIKSISANNISIDDYGVIPIQLTVHQVQ
jgi:hypothetical protein